MSRPRLSWLTVFLCLAVVQVVGAQVSDTTRVAPVDTTQVLPADSLRIRPQPVDSLEQPVVFADPVSFLDIESGIVVVDTLPARHPAMDPVELLGEVPGSFVYDFAAAGWPDGWSPFALNPTAVGLSFNGIPFDNTLVGRPDYELLPFALLQPFRLEAGRFGLPIGVNTRLRAYDATRPQTHIRYRSSNNGLNSVLVVHSQQRRLKLAGQPGVIAFALGYGGHGANGEYPGSKLEGGRQLLARVRYKHPWGSIELLNLQNRRRLGAHAGVQPFSSDFNSIYNRLSAQVEDPNASRQDIRNDLALTVRKSVVPGLGDPFTLTGYWTAQTFRYVNGDSLQARSSRLGYRASQTFGSERFSASLNLEGWSEGLRDDSTTFGDSLFVTRRFTHASFNGRFNLGGLSLEVEPGWHVLPDESYVGGSLRVSYGASQARLFAEGAYSGKSLSWVEEYGWGDTFLPLVMPASSNIGMARAGVTGELGPVDLGVTAFAHRVDNPVDVFSINQDTVQVQQLADPLLWLGGTVDLGFRRHRQRGFYLTLTPGVYQMNNAEDSPEHRILSHSLPEVFIRGRMGLRYVLFRGDLDMDLYGRGRLWSPFLSRTLHPETGLLVLRNETDREVEASASLDIVLEAGVRTAKIFLAFENLLSGTSFVPGNMLVPNYPLPARRFRFSVFWPIQD